MRNVVVLKELLTAVSRRSDMITILVEKIVLMAINLRMTMTSIIALVVDLA